MMPSLINESIHPRWNCLDLDLAPATFVDRLRKEHQRDQIKIAIKELKPLIGKEPLS
jgi:hypothetical protein